MKRIARHEGKLSAPPLHAGVVSREIIGKNTLAQHAAIHVSTIAPGGGSEIDFHARSEQTFYVLSGQLTFLAEGSELVAQAGDAVFIAAGEPHATANEGEIDAVCLVVTAPPL
jgi:quercetin dioxygenase-like cupin family protein